LKNIIVITGASSGFGALAARAQRRCRSYQGRVSLIGLGDLLVPRVNNR